MSDIDDVIAAMGRLAALVAKNDEMYPNEQLLYFRPDLADLRACADVERMLGVLASIAESPSTLQNCGQTAVISMSRELFNKLTPPGGASAHSDLDFTFPGPTEQAAARGGTTVERAVLFAHLRSGLRNIQPKEACAVGAYAAQLIDLADRAPSEVEGRGTGCTRRMEAMTLARPGSRSGGANDE